MLDIYLDKLRKRRFGTRRNRIYYLSFAAIAFFVLTAISIILVAGMFLWYAKDLPRPDKVNRSEGLSTVVLDRNGQRLYDIFENENRIAVKFEDIPDYLKKATVAIEDKNFYKHQGLSQAGLIRAVINIFIFRNLQGGSTLTQQLVKTVLLSSERTLPRKIKEAILALQIERKYSKDEILRMYLNEVPYGGTAVGVESASQYYFNKPVKDLSLIESALLAGLPQSPSAYSPFIGSKDAYIWRTEQVLRRMREDNYISKTQETESIAQLKHLTFADAKSNLKAPHFVEYVKKVLIEKIGAKKVDQGGLTVTTTLDWKLQEKAQDIVAEEVQKAKSLSVSNGAAVVINPENGEILSMVGSRDYSATDSSGLMFNVATQGLRQPGSSLKPITYAVAFKKGYTPSSVLMDVDTKYPAGQQGKPDYNPKNYDLKFRGPMQLRFALANSINTVAVKVSALVGISDILKTAYDMGITSLEPTSETLSRVGLSLTLGGAEVTLLDLTSAYGVFATGGNHVDPVSILKVTDSKNNTVYEQKDVSRKKVLSSEICYLISSILSDNEARSTIFGLRSYLFIPGKTVAVKTGTTDDKRDNWTVGYSTKRVVGVWVGNNDNSPMNSKLASGVTGASPIWNRIIKEALADLPEESFPKPDSVIEMEIDAFGGGLPVEGQPKRKEFFIKGTEPTGPSLIYQFLKVSLKDENKLANIVDINKGEYKEKMFIVIKENDPISTDGKNRWQEGIDSWISQQSDSKYHPPTETSKDGDEISVHMSKPEDMKQYDSNDIEVRADAAGFKDIKTMEVYIDDEKKFDRNSAHIAENLNVPDGSHIIKVKAIDVDGKSSERSARVGIKVPYTTPSPTPTLSPIATPTNSPSPTP